jgi:hypothetical protein
MRTKAQLVPASQTAITTGSSERRLRTVVARRTEEILAEVAPTVRRLRTFLLVMTISLPLFLAGLVAALWHLAH